MADNPDRGGYTRFDSKHKKSSFSGAWESEHIKERSPSNGNRYNPYGKPTKTSSSDSHQRLPDAKSRDRDSRSRDCKADHGEKQENDVYRIPTQSYPSFEAKGPPPKVMAAAAAPVQPAAPPKKKMTVASVFNCDSSDEEEEMPLHAKMKMRNVGKDTPTSSGPNSFGKTKRGFTDTVKMWEKDPVKVAKDIVKKKPSLDGKDD